MIKNVKKKGRVDTTSTAEESHSVGWMFLSYILSFLIFFFYRRDSGKCHTLPFFLTFFLNNKNVLKRRKEWGTYLAPAPSLESKDDDEEWKKN